MATLSKVVSSMQMKCAALFLWFGRKNPERFYIPETGCSAMIEHYEFGKFVVDGKEYESNIVLLGIEAEIDCKGNKLDW